MIDLAQDSVKMQAFPSSAISRAFSSKRLFHVRNAGFSVIAWTKGFCNWNQKNLHVFVFIFSFFLFPSIELHDQSLILNIHSHFKPIVVTICMTCEGD